MKSLWASLAEILSAAACAKCSESHGHLTPGSPSMNPAASASHLAAIAKLQTSDKCWTASLIAYCDTQLISILFCLEFLIVTWVWDFGLLSGTSAQPEWAPEQLTVVQHETHEITGSCMKLHCIILYYIALNLPYWSCCHVLQIVADSPHETHAFAGPGHTMPCRACALWVTSVSSIILIRAEIFSSSVSMMTPLSVTCQNGTVADSSCQAVKSISGHSLGNTGAANLI